MTLGLVLMIFSGDALLNTLAVLGYIHLVKTNVIAMRAQMVGSFNHIPDERN